MLKFEWPLILPENEDIRRLSRATFDLSEYVVDIARRQGLAPGLQPVPGGVAVHIACHARAQNMGQKAAELLRLLPDIEVEVTERCSGHGGAWGFRKEHFATALKVGRPAAKRMRESSKAYATSECPLAGIHIRQGMQRAGGSAPMPALISHPIELIARAYGITI
jgi:glycerol-3-phosphate dehydrogenase subunit C